MGVARLRRGDGRMVDVELTARRFLDTDGSVQIFSILRDMAGRVAKELEIQELSARVLELSRCDELTGFRNRRGLIADGSRLLQFADLEGAGVQVMFADVDNVASLNTSLGHQAGDAALQAVARALAVGFRKNDVLARIGGTQFLVLALNLGEPECASITSRIEDHLASPVTVDFVGAEVEAWLGWTTRRAGDGGSLEELMARSDWAMLEARDARRGVDRPLRLNLPA